MIGRVFRVVRTPITLLILLGVLLYGAWWGYTNIIRKTPEAAPAPCVQQTLKKGKLKSSQVTVKIFNGGQRIGLAGDVARAMRGKGFKVGLTDNTQEQIGKTVIVGADKKAPEVIFVKTFFKSAEIRADKSKENDRTVDILVGNDYRGFNKKAKNTYTVKAKTVCLPAQSTSATPSPSR